MTHTSHAAGGVSGACPDLDTLADLHAGVLDATTASTLREHVDSCSDCAAVIAALDATVMSLGAMPRVEIPVDVAARIDSALAAEAGRVGLSDDTTSALAARPPTAPTSDRRLGAVPAAQTPSVPSGATGGTVTSLAAHREKRRFGSGRMLLAAAAAAVVVGGGAVILGQSGGDSPSHQADQQSSRPASPNTAEERPDVQAFAAPKDVLQAGAIENDQVSEEVAGKMAEKTARAQCLNQIVPRPASAPEAVQQGTHDGKAAYAFVFPTDNENIVEMIIVDAADCSTTLDSVTGPRE